MKWMSVGLTGVVLLIAVGLALGIGGSSVAQVLTGGRRGPSGPAHTVTLVVPSGNRTANLGAIQGAALALQASDSTTVRLLSGPSAVVDADGLDGEATLQLPNTGAGGATTYALYVRLLGKPAAWKDDTGSVRDDDGAEWQPVYSTVTAPGAGESVNIASQLLTISIDLNNDGYIERYSLFDARLQNYFWRFDGANQKVAQVRLYEAPPAKR